MEVMGCVVCQHPETHIIDRFLRLPAGTPGRRGPRSLAKPFGLDRRDIQAHEKRCLETAEEGVGGITKCSGIKASGERCRNRPTTGSDWCPAHDPDRAQARRESASKAGKARGPTQELVELRGRIRKYMDRVERGTLEKGKASVLAQLAGVAGRLYEVERRIVETEQLAQKVAELEDLIEQQAQRGHYYGA